ncbi:luc7-like protein 3 [Ischnura elegans]|uniref:luc7-like protein 3 n=1 Tax=Ischnura elegans TaxID=197161 RepID=UPI001ED8AED4|nr:luc7-like protein 3 [Ischnura elegans]
MAVLAAAALLDELMGRNRNVLPNEKHNEINWEDPEICKLYLVNFCPHDLFVNTRADLGPCNKIHDDEFKQHFEKASPYKRQPYEDEFIRFCQGMLNEVERKIMKGKQRLALTGKGDTPTLTPAQQQRNDEQIQLLSEKINRLVDEAEQMGIQGNVEKAQGLMKLCDQLKDEREALKRQNENSHWQQTAEMAAAQEKQMEVCDVCGAFLIVGDAQQRIDDHLTGKQHVGYAKLKAAIDEIMTNRQKSREDKEKKRDEERNERLKQREEEEKRKEKEREERRRLREEEEKRSRKSRYRSRSPRHNMHSSGRSERGGIRDDRGDRHGDRKDRKRSRGSPDRGRYSPHSSRKSDHYHSSRSRSGGAWESGHERHRGGRSSDKDRGSNGEFGYYTTPHPSTMGDGSYYDDVDSKKSHRGGGGYWSSKDH